MRQDEITAAYDAAAATYDTSGVTFFTAVGARLVREAGIGPGWRVLDAGCGASAATIPAAYAVGPEGSVTGIDLSRKMLARTAAVCTVRNLDNVTVALADAHDPPYAPGSFDAVLASMLVFLLEDPARAARAWHRVLRPGGVTAFSWIIAEDPRWVPVVAAVDARVPGGAGFAGLWHHPPFTSLSDVELMLTGTGYSEVATTEVIVPRRYTGPRQWWAVSWSQAPMLAWQQIPPGQRAVARDEVFRMLEDMREPDGSLVRETLIGYTTGERRPDGISHA
jgi:O-methyltransferase/aklanonic acid methyltransferase